VGACSELESAKLNIFSPAGVCGIAGIWGIVGIWGMAGI